MSLGEPHLKNSRFWKNLSATKAKSFGRCYCVTSFSQTKICQIGFPKDNFLIFPIFSWIYFSQSLIWSALVTIFFIIIFIFWWKLWSGNLLLGKTHSENYQVWCSDRRNPFFSLFILHKIQILYDVCGICSLHCVITCIFMIADRIVLWVKTYKRYLPYQINSSVSYGNGTIYPNHFCLETRSH